MIFMKKSEISSTWDTKTLRSVSPEQENMSTGLVSQQKSITCLMTAALVLMNAINNLLNQLYPINTLIILSETPWSKIGTDIFKLHKNPVNAIDYTTKFFGIHSLTDK